ncbi:MAG TPA: tetratricopeptide repeat protein [Candidatus Acidoferrum sp.]|nr:tetratricopeptide repeat protein [Candidatus Acidoferrum sp.]
MILRLSTPAARALLVFVAVVFAVALSYSGIRNSLAVQFAGQNTLESYERATRFEPDDARNWYLLGRYWQYNLEDPDAQRAIRTYQTSLSLDPHSADTWLDLATAYESEDDLAAARNAFLQAKRSYPLSPEVSWRYGNFLLRRGETDAAFAQFRIAVQSDPKRGAAAFAISMRLDPDIHAVLDRVFPHSQDAYLSVINALSEQGQTDQALVVWAALANLHPRMRLLESYPFLNALTGKRQMLAAKQVWDQALEFAGLSRPADPSGSLVWDGGFESDVPVGGLNWYYPAFVGGVQIGLDTGEKHSGKRSLRLTFNGLNNVNFNDVCQYIAVQPSTSYHFSAWLQTRSLSTDQGVRFGLHSMSDTVNSMAWTDDLQGTQPWTHIELPWTSGNDVQELVLCVSRNASRKFDSKIRGSAWIDDVALVPAPPEPAKP